MAGLLVLIIVGFIAQLVDGSLGMAYGATSTTLLLAAGLAPAAASAAVHLSEVGTTLVSGFSHWKFDNIDWRVVWRVGIPGALGAFAGAVLLSNLSTEAGKPWMAGFLLTWGVYVMLRFTFRVAPIHRGARPVRGRFLAALGLFAGFVDATGGGGWGPIGTPTLLATGKMEPRKIIGSIDASEFLVAGAASIGFLLTWSRHGVPMSVVGALLAGGLVAAPLAAWLVRHMPARILGASAGGMIVLTNLRTMLDHFTVADRLWIYATVTLLWAAAVAMSTHAHRAELRRSREILHGTGGDVQSPSAV